MTTAPCSTVILLGALSEGMCFTPSDPIEIHVGHTSRILYASCDGYEKGQYHILLNFDDGESNPKTIEIAIPKNSITYGCEMTIIIAGTEESSYEYSNICIASHFGKVVGTVKKS